ncbi:MAG: tetratricopeptide repeat protein, partial [Hyphomicrobiaceae bacterium]|nr:tetratricopeptide repeat protein [Hyphomicrobiaceae bacterium]
MPRATRRHQHKPRAALARRVLAVGALAACCATLALGAAPARAQQQGAEVAALRQREAASALQRGQTEEAVGHYTTALSLADLPNDRRATLLNDRAVAYVRLGKTKLALEDFNKAIELFPEYAPTYNNRGNLLMALGLDDEAIKDFNRAIVLAPGYAAAYNNRAGVLMRTGALAAAIADYTQAVKLAPASAAPLTGRGSAHLMQGRPYLAMRDFSRAVGTEARFAAAYRNRAEALIELSRYEEAIEDLSRAIAFDVANSELYLLRGHGYLAVGNSDAAVQDFSRTIELSPANAGGYEARGLALALGETPDGAFADLNRAIEIAPKSATAFAYRGYAYARLGQPDVAARDLDNAETIDKRSPEVFWARGASEELAGQADAAVEHFRRALELRPGFKRARDALARLGAEDAGDSDRPLEGLGADGWQIVAAGARFVATSDAYPGVRVPIEVIGEGKPKILAWRPGEPPFRDIGVLTYRSGSITGTQGPEETEIAAIVDIRARAVAALVPHRQGEKVSQWTWTEDGKVTVAAIDGTTEDLTLREQRMVPLAGRTGVQRYSTPGGTPSWAPWAQLDPASGPQDRPRRAASAPKKKKP